MINTKDEGNKLLMTQALIVCEGPFKGRICENDDDVFVLKADLQEEELEWFEAADAQWEKLYETEIDEDGEIVTEENNIGISCEIVTFVFYLHRRGYQIIPRQFLRPANMNDLISRMEEIDQLVFKHAWKIGVEDYSDELCDYLLEKDFIVNEVSERELLVRERISEKKTIFLSHSSADKGFVRRIFADLKKLGHNPWLDELDIQVGESIVEQISMGTASAEVLILFLSPDAVESFWVKREWKSSLARQLAEASIKILPALIEPCEIPPVLSDIKYADFTNSYNAGLHSLIRGLATTN